MRTQIIDDKTFGVGDHVFEVGDTLELTPEEQDQLERLAVMSDERFALQQALIDVCLTATRNFVPESAEKADRIQEVTLDMSFIMNGVLAAVQRRLGGLLPLQFSDDYRSLEVTAKNPQHELNYTMSYIKKQVGYDQFDDIVTVIRSFTPPEKLVFNLMMNKDYGFQPIISNVATEVEPLTLATAVAGVLTKKDKITPFIGLIGCEAALEDGPEMKNIFTLENIQRPQRFEKIVALAKEVKPKTIVVVRISPGTDAGVLVADVGLLTKKENGKIAKITIPVELTRQPKAVAVGEPIIDKFDAGEQYERFLT